MSYPESQNRPPIPNHCHTMPSFAVAQIGARLNYGIPAALARAGCLGMLHTDLHRDHWLSRVCATAVPTAFRPPTLRGLAARGIPDVPSHRIRSYPSFSLYKLLCGSSAASPGAKRRFYARSNAFFGRLVVRHWTSHADRVFVFNTAGKEILREGTRRGLRTYLGQTAAPVCWEEELMAEERERWPGWESGEMSRGDWEPLAERESAEWGMADRILCCSGYVRRCLARLGVPPDRCIVLPYGVEERYLGPPRDSRVPGPLRVLFVGALRLQKGIQYFMEVARALGGPDYSFRAVGSVWLAPEAKGEVAECVDVPGPVPRSDVPGEYRRADVLVLPSLSDGFGHVVSEALANGVPVIVTENTGAADIVRPGIDGFVVPIRDVAGIARHLVALHDDPGLLLRMSKAAFARAREYAGTGYDRDLLEALDCGASADTGRRGANGGSLHV